MCEMFLIVSISYVLMCCFRKFVSMSSGMIPNTSAFDKLDSKRFSGYFNVEIVLGFDNGDDASDYTYNVGI